LIEIIPEFPDYVPPLLSITNLNGWFPDPAVAPESGTEIQVLKDVSLDIGPVQTVALVGESGSGKTITALSILRLLEESSTIRLSGSISFKGEELLDAPMTLLRNIRGNRIAMIFQEPMTSLNPVYSVGNQLVESLRLHRRMNRQAATDEAVRLLTRTRIDEPEARMYLYPHQLSGGQRQRVMIAMALACRPDLLIADEPTTALDVSIQSDILDLIQDIQQEERMAMLLITHDLQMVRRIAEHIYIMKEGRVVEDGGTEQIFTRPQDPYTLNLMSAIPAPAPRRDTSGEPVLQTEHLSCSFSMKTEQGLFLRKKKKTIHAVDQVSLSLRRGSTCGIIGESGSGKTTLGMALLRLVKSSGPIVFKGVDLQPLSQKEIHPFRSRMQVVFQDPFSSLSPRLTIGEIVDEGLRVHRKNLPLGKKRELVAGALRDVGLDPDIVSRYPHEFSGGQRQRIAIARVIILQPELLILDEPTSALDMTIQAQIISLLRELQDKYRMTYLFISHDLKVVRALADYLIVMRDGRIVEEGEAHELFENPVERYTRRLFSTALN
jgi:microcin C transport system ATP-binding protein